MPPLKPYTFAIRSIQRYTKNCKRVCLPTAHILCTDKEENAIRAQESLWVTMYKRNKGIVLNPKVPIFLQSFGNA